jgi:hypothetical protein
MKETRIGYRGYWIYLLALPMEGMSLSRCYVAVARADGTPVDENTCPTTEKAGEYGRAIIDGMIAHGDMEPSYWLSTDGRIQFGWREGAA